jgi:predicted dehydrogenase
VLGAADIAAKAVLPAIAASRNGRLVSIASRDRDRAEAMGSQHGVPRVAESYEALLDDPEVDAVYIPLVNSVHREWTLKSLAAGKHVLCEKPLGMDAAEAEEMAQAAEASGLRLMEAFMYRFHPRIRAFVEAAHKPLFVQSNFGFPLRDRANVRMKPELGGGALLDIGCYTVSVARWLLGEPHEVRALARIDPEAGVDMTVTALLSFESGATAAVWSSFESPEEQRLTVVTREEAHRLDRPFSSWRDPDDPYQLMVESFGDSVLHDGPVAIPLSESIANMRVLDRIREAARF